MCRAFLKGINFSKIFIGLIVLMLQQHQLLAQNNPTFTSTPSAGITYGETYDYLVEVTDLEDDGIDVVIQSGSLPGGLNFTDNLDGTYSIAGDPTEAGTFPITLEVREVLNNANSNTQAFNIEVAKAQLNVIADNKTITYGDALPTLTFSFNAADFVNSETEAVIDVDPNISTTATIASNAGTYPITLANGSDDNYSFIFTDATLEIAQASQTITFTDPADKTYGDADFNLVASSDSGLPVDFSIVSGPAALSGSIVTITGAGTVVVEATQAGDVNYTSATPVQQSFEVAKAQLNVIADNKNITYGDAIPTLTFSFNATDFVNSETEAVIDVDPDISTTATIASDAGTYPITLVDGSDDNYSFIFTQATLEITQASQTITFTDPADKTYGDADFNLIASSDSGLPVDFSIVSGPATLSGSTVTITGAGTVVVEATQAGDVNYTAATPVQQSFEVAKAQLNVIADNKTITYGDAIPTLTFSFNAADFVNSETEAVIDVDPDISTTATIASDAGTYSITLADGSDDNYSFIFTQATLEITQASQTITFTDPADKTYGDADFNLIASSDSGLPVDFSIFSGPATLSGSIVTITGAGTVVVEATQTGDINYTAATPVQQSFEVAKAQLNVIADNKTITYGDAIPTLTFSFNAADFVNSETEAVIDVDPDISTTATIASDAGTYPITLADGNDDNYTFLFTDATLEITQASQTITFTDPADKTYGDADFNLVASSDSGLPVSFSIISGPATLSGSTVTITGAGTVVVEATQAGDVNYTAATPVQHSFEVAKATATITFTQLLKNFNGSPKSADFTTTPEGLNTTVTYNNSSTIPTIPGSYDIEVTIDESNYEGTASATFVINGAPNVTSIGPFNYNEDESPISNILLLNYFSDVEDNPSQLNFSLIGRTNSSLYNSFTLAGNEISLSLAANAFGSSIITIRCTDSNGLSTDQSFTINVAPVQDDPLFTSTPQVSVNEDFTYQYNITAADADPSDELSITNQLALPAWLSLTDNGDGTALLTGTPNNTQVGNYGVALEVNDGNGNTAQQLFNIEVINTNDKPIITSTPVLTASLNTLYSYTFTATDVDPGDELTTTVNQKPSWITATETEPGKLVLSGTPTNNDRDESTDVSITVSDLADAETTQNFTISVNFPNSAPVFTSSPQLEVNEDELYQYEIAVNDIDNDSYTLEALLKPDWLNFTNENDQYSLQGTPLNEDVGTHQVILRVQDQLGANTTQNYTIEVINVNDTPVFVTTPILEAQQNNTYNLLLEVLDVDANDELTFSFIQQPTWLTINASNTLTGTPNREDVENSPHVVEIKVEDNAGASDTLSFSIEVKYENSAPTLDPVPEQIELTEDDLAIKTILLTGITAGEENNQSISTSIDNSNEALFESFSLNYTSPQSTAEISYQLKADAFGEAVINITVTDDGAEDINSISDSFTIAVEGVNDAPVFNSDPVVKAQSNTAYTYNIEVDDADPADLLTISQVVGPSWLSVTNQNNRSAVLTGMVPETATSEQITLRVTDESGEFAEQAFTIQINTQPVINNYEVELNEDEAFILNSDLLNTLYSDEDDDPFTKIILNWGAGSITSNGAEITKGQELDISEGVALTYKAPDNYSGTQTISYTVSDPFIFSEEAIITLTFLPVNDAPTITNIESETLEYVQGASPIQITSSITISDIDDQMIDSAWVKISSSYNQSEDELILETDAEVTSRFERNSGTLLITGQLSKSEYEIILSEVAYFNSNELTDDTTPKSISFQISDGDSLSNVLSRNLVISEVLPELEIYTAFTPNGDGINDTWRFPNIDQFEDVQIKISDLNGREIFNCRGQTCEWDGVYNSEVLPAGTYFYNVSLNGGRRKYDGTVTIIK
jgi:gliding motility-associated-like protein